MTRTIRAAVVTLCLVAIMAMATEARANTQATVVNGQTDLTLDTTYDPVAVPSSTTDVVWSGAYSPNVMLVDNGATLTVGSLNNLATNSLTVTGSVGSSTLTLAGGVNSVPGAAPGDLIYTTSASTFSFPGGPSATPGPMVINLATTGNFNVASTGTLAIGTLLTGTGGFTKTGTGTLTLACKNNFTGGMTLAEGTVLVSTNADANTLASTLGTGAVTMNNGTTLARTAGGSTSNIFQSTLTFAGDVTIGTVLASGSLPGRIRYNGILDMQGGTRQVTLAQGASLTSDGSEQFSFYRTGALASPSAQNGTVSFVAGAGASGTAPAQVRITSTTSFTGNAGLSVGENVLLRITTTNTTSAETSPKLTVNGLAYFGEGTSSRSMNVFSLSGTGVITDPVLSTFSSGTATVIIDGSETATFAGRITNGADQQVLQAGGWADGYGTMAVTKRGTGTQIFSGANSYAGTTRIEGGTLLVNGDQSAASGAVDVVAGGTLGGTGTLGGATTIRADATLAPGVTTGNLTVSQDVFWSGAGNYNWQIGSATGSAGSSWDLLTLTGSLSITSSDTNQFQLNLWSLSGTSSGQAANFDASQNYTWKIASATGGIDGFSADRFMINTSAINGTGGFANGLAGGTFSIAQSGNDLNLVFTAAGGPPSVITINVASGTQTQTAAGYPTLSGAVPVVKTGAGTLVVDQVNTLTGSTTIQGGVLQLANFEGLKSSTIYPVAGGTMTLAPYQTAVVGGLDPNAGGLTDVGSGLVTVSSGLSAGDLVTAIVAGLGDGSWNGSAGITSSVVAADAQLGIPRAVGWLDNGDGTVTFAYAAPGDTNLDWSIDLLDIGTYLAGAKYDTGEPSSWSEGDYTYDGIVDITDVALYLGTALFDVGPYNLPADGAGGVAAVPEPAGVGLAMVGAMAAIGVRVCRRKRTP